MRSIKSKWMVLVLVGIVSMQTAYAKEETWYWGFKLGGGSTGFGGTMGNSYSSYASNPNYSRLTVASELGFYWPLSNETVLGVASGGAGTSYSSSLVSNLSQTFGVSLLTASLMHTFGPEPCVGPYVRADLGFATAYQAGGAALFSTSGDSGLGFRAGGGFGIALSDETRL
ncbi:MAG: hypothetical protein AABZ55_10590, partial [Bdellovibrionota bacterium]